MDAALSDPEEGYYMRRAPFGTPHDGGGDFTTAPEISQMFGELVGAWCLDLWARSGHPSRKFGRVGAGRGTLMADICRTTGRNSDFSQHLSVHFVETSPTLRAEQKKRVPDANWHDNIATLPDNAATLVIANEFFDALPITQYARTPSGWREITVTLENNELAFAHGPEQKNPFSPVQAALLPNTAPEEIIEASPARELVMQNLCTHLKRVRGAALIIDYGHARPAAGDSFQAMKHHEFVNPLARPGEADLTAHVNFAVLSQLAAATGLEAYPIAQQGEFLRAWGLTSAPRNLPRQAPTPSAKLWASATGWPPRPNGAFVQGFGVTPSRHAASCRI